MRKSRRLPAAIMVAVLIAALSPLAFIVVGAKAEMPPPTPAVSSPQPKVKADQEAIKDQIVKYVRSIDGADTKLAAEVWADSAEVTFIHPRGHEKGWDQVKKNFYEKTMAGPFSERKLKIVGDVSVHVYGDAAWAEFYWDFVAKFKKDGTPLHTKGRETQVFHKEGGGWRLVHVHYSGMPVGGGRSGF
jgi:ketosteroid isomerase-like protein